MEFAYTVLNPSNTVLINEQVCTFEEVATKIMEDRRRGIYKVQSWKKNWPQIKLTTHVAVAGHGKSTTHEQLVELIKKERLSMDNSFKMNG